MPIGGGLVSWVDIENAMQTAISKASGFTADKIIWSYQDFNEPALDHVVITFGGEIAIGQDWIRLTQNLNRPNGQEIKQDIRGVREVPFQIEVFTSAIYGDSAARRVAELIRTKLRLPDVRYGLRKAGISPFDSDPVQYIPDIDSANFRGRAIVNVRCYVPVMDCFEYCGYIARVRGWIHPTGMLAVSGTSGFPFNYGIGTTAGTLAVYWGLAVPASITEAFITGLSDDALAAGFARTLQFDAGDGTMKAYYAFPSTFGTPVVFRDAYTGFGIPNTKVGDEIDVTDELGVIRPYDVWATDDFPTVAFSEQVH